MANPKPHNTFIAFLRGINVGGRTIKMDELKKALESLGFQNVQTVLASGNVIFEAVKTTTDVLTKQIEQKLAETFKYEAHVMVRTVEEVQEMIKLDPFQGINVTPDTRLYVTLVAEKISADKREKHQSENNDFQIIKVTDFEIYSFLIVSPENRTVDAMKILEVKYGKNITTRNWNTIHRILKKVN